MEITLKKKLAIANIDISKQGWNLETGCSFDDLPSIMNI